MQSIETRVAVLEDADDRRNGSDAAHQRNIEELNITLALTIQSVDNLQNEIHAMRGMAWKVLLGLAAIVTFIVNLFEWLFDHLKNIFVGH